MKTIKIQPEEHVDGKLPYPFFIDTVTLEVGRQDFWRGQPAKLLGFATPGDSYTVTLTAADFVTNPEACIDLDPVFLNEGGKITTWTTAIESVQLVNLDD